jgi:ribosomal protein S18 acetylase RimI-like enzyme
MLMALDTRPQIINLGHANHDQALRLVLDNPLNNAIIIADLTQLSSECSILAKCDGQKILALASYYMDLPFTSIAFHAQSEVDIAELISEFGKRHPGLLQKTIFGLHDEKTAGIINECFSDVQAMPELQMVLRNDSIADVPIDNSQYRIERLTADDLIQISHLYSLVPAMAWTPKALSYGPCYGAFYQDTLVSIAGVHYLTRWVAEIGNVVTHPKHRRMNLAYACTKAVADALRGSCENIFLCVMSDNAPAIRLYEKMGFVTHQELFLMRYNIH